MADVNAGFRFPRGVEKNKKQSEQTEIKYFINKWNRRFNVHRFKLNEAVSEAEPRRWALMLVNVRDFILFFHSPQFARWIHVSAMRAPMVS